MADAPGLQSALVAALRETLEATRDHWVRAELSPDWPVGAALEELRGDTTSLRVGVLRPFEGAQLADFQGRTSIDPQQITLWRNEKPEVRARFATIVLGDATGPREKGLLRAPRILYDAGVLELWGARLGDWLREEVHSETPQALYAELSVLAQTGAVDAVRMDEYVAAALQAPDLAVARSRDELWRLNLLPDNHALDTGVAAGRLELNLHTRQFLVSASDTPRDARRLARLDDAASQGSGVARQALKYRRTKSRQDLTGLDLDELLALFQTTPAPRPPMQPRPLDLLEFLDATYGAPLEDVQEALKALQDAWNLESLQGETLIAEFQPAGADEPREVSVRVEPTPIEETLWIGDGTPERQVISYSADHLSVHDWLPFPTGGTPVMAVALLNAARAQDTMIGRLLFEPLVTEYIAARGALAEYTVWIRHSLFPLLVLHPAARETVTAYLDAWQALATAATDATPEESLVVRGALLQLEAVWGIREEEPDWCVLGPTHPYVLDPVLRVANDALASVGTLEPGKKAGWALDRSVPAYRALWTAEATLFLAKRDDIIEFQRAPSGHHPAVTSGDGLSQVARAFLGFHPYAAESMVITLIDPPKGGAVAKNLRQLARLVGDLRIYLVTTTGDAAQLEELGDTVRNLGRFASLDEWLARAPVRSNIAVYFAERPAGSDTAAGTGWGPTPGSHVALTIRPAVTDPLSDATKLSPFVTFEPRANNGPVVAIQRLATATQGTPHLFRMQPMLDKSEIERLERVADVTDWAVIAAPAPLGLVAPRTLGSGMTYVGRETLGVYGLFTYATSLFSVRKHVTEGLRNTPVQPVPDEVEAQLSELALQTPNGVLRIGRSGTAMWEQIGVIASSAIGQHID